MAQKPLSEMADTGYENMSEEAGYVLHELKLFARTIDNFVNNSMTSDEIIQQFNDIHSRLEKFISKEDILLPINTISDKLDKLTSAIIALATKLDTEDVTNLDTDYLDSVESELN